MNGEESESVPVSGDGVQQKNRRLEIREFSRSTEEGRKNRHKTAQAILRERSERGQRRSTRETELSQEKQATQHSLETLNSQIAEVEDRVLEIRGEFNRRTTNWFLRAWQFLNKGFKQETRQLPASIGQLEERLSWTKNLCNLRREQLDSLERQFQELSQFHRLNIAGRDTLHNFYAQQGKLFDGHQQELESQRQMIELERYRTEHGSVRDVARQYHSYIVHGISPSFGSFNGPLTENAGWLDKLMVVISENPPLAASAFVEGSGPQNLWGPIGVVIGEGVVVDAAGGDATTYVDSQGIRRKASSASQATSVERYQYNLSRAMSTAMEMSKTRHEPFHHNELILGFGTRPSAFYINLDQAGNCSFDEGGIRFINGVVDFKQGLRLDLITFREIFEAANFVGLPVVVIRDGVMYRCEIDNTTGRLIGGERFSHQEAVSRPVEVPGDNVLEIQRRSRSVLKTLAVA